MHEDRTTHFRVHGSTTFENFQMPAGSWVWNGEICFARSFSFLSIVFASSKAASHSAASRFFTKLCAVPSKTKVQYARWITLGICFGVAGSSCLATLHLQFALKTTQKLLALGTLKSLTRHRCFWMHIPSHSKLFQKWKLRAFCVKSLCRKVTNSWVMESGSDLGVLWIHVDPGSYLKKDVRDREAIYAHWILIVICFKSRLHGGGTTWLLEWPKNRPGRLPCV